jgi:hypothetical protein
VILCFTRARYRTGAYCVLAAFNLGVIHIVGFDASGLAHSNCVDGVQIWSRGRVELCQKLRLMAL